MFHLLSRSEMFREVLEGGGGSAEEDKDIEIQTTETNKQLDDYIRLITSAQLPDNSLIYFKDLLQLTDKYKDITSTKIIEQHLIISSSEFNKLDLYSCACRFQLSNLKSNQLNLINKEDLGELSEDSNLGSVDLYDLIKHSHKDRKFEDPVETRTPPIMSQEDSSFVKLSVFGNIFQVTTRYTDLQPVGMGAFGLLCSSTDQKSGGPVAIKKVMKPFSAPVLAKRTYRELKLLKHLRHENIISLLDVFISPGEDIYFITELLGTDLHRLLSSRPLERQFVQYFLYQMLRALKFVHPAGVVHRDLKPSNILINENCDLKICDFGLARLQDPQMTGYVSTRYYRAPEIMLTWQEYDSAVDIWSVGCIFAEMIDGRPIFPGKDHVHQLTVITELLGSPPEDVINTITSENTRRFVDALPKRHKISFADRFPNANAEEIDLLEKMLDFNPKKRITAADALAHPYLAPYHDPEDEPTANERFDWSFNDADLPTDQWKVMMYSEILDFHNVDVKSEKDMTPSTTTAGAH
ncbi:Mitogen-activated protein kinase HOG1 [Wallemia ichthyophaga EXF-994]|nr:Mitogen-activated protein kinase HOG1 [Wallemia ichthyophaga EXF-994]EOR02032.1 Mitogen-activated protein kinase HOG1 [Wallemia ichthyophaga EXF-994]